MAQREFDLAITGGTVMDPETGLDAIRNVGIVDGTIVSITTNTITGRESIDATGLVVAPGFIDPHVHTVTLPFGQKVKLRDGVTTQLDLEAGAHPVDRFYDALEGTSQANYGATVNSMGAREQTFDPSYHSHDGNIVTDFFSFTSETGIDMAWSSTVPDAAQIDQISEYVDEGLKQGALGVGCAVGYMTYGVTPQETSNWQRLAAKYGRAMYVHARYSSQRPPATGLLAFEEIIANAAIYGNGVFFHHMHQQALNDTVDALELFDEAAKKGIRVIGEIYPYTYGATIVGADYLKPEVYLPNMGHGYDGIVEVSTLKPLTKERYDHLMATNPAESVMFSGCTDEIMCRALAHPSTVVASDAFPLNVAATGDVASDWNTPYEGNQGHPRAAGTAGRFLRLVREQKMMPLMLAISKMSYMVADWLQANGVPQMAYKGRIQLGADADLAIFHPATVTDNATMQEAGLPTTGIPHVVVSGTIVIKDSEVLEGVFPGKPLRLPVAV